MKIIVILFGATLGLFTLEAQTLLIKKKDGIELKVKVLASNKSEIRSNANEHVLYSDMDSVTFQNYLSQRDDALVRKLKSAGVTVTGIPETGIQEQSVPIEQSKAYTSAYSNFLVDEGKIIWRLVYEKPGVSEDSLKKIIYDKVISDNSLRIMEEGSNELVIEMHEKIFEKNGDLYNARISIAVKNGKYRVTMQTIRRFFGVKTKNLALISGVSNEINTTNVGIPLEDTFLTKDGKLKGLSGLEKLNQQFEKAFKLSLSKPDDDW